MSPEFWQALLAAELSPNKAREAISAFRAVSRSEPDPLAWLLRQPWLTENERKRLLPLKPDALARALEMGATFVTPDQYPEPLLQVPYPPALFVRGNPEVLSKPTIAIVGTRGASPYGKAVADRFARAFARSGVTVVSGGALGIDAAAHRGTLEEGGATAAILGGGIDRIYPAVHKSLFDDVARTGCVVSQFAAGCRPSGYKFLVRNGMIAALSLAVVLIECPKRSGAMNTAHHANEMGRQVFVVPANIDRPSFAGSHALIRDGATLVDDPDQVLEALRLEPAKPVVIEVGKVAAKILDALSTDPLPIEQILDRTKLELEDALAELTMMELDGLVVKESAGFRRTL